MAEEYKQIESDPIVGDLEEQAYVDAGSAKGDSSVFRNKLDLIFNGALLDKSTYLSRTPEEVEAIKGQISAFEIKLAGIKMKVDQLKESVSMNQKKIDDFKGKYDQYTAGGLSGDKIGSSFDHFSTSKFVIASFFLLMLSIFIFLFYIAVVYKAIIMNESEIADQFVQGVFGVNVLPQWSEVYRAMTTNFMVIFAPFVFFGFGYAVHTLLELNHKIKYLWISLVIAITFILDYFLADRIHDKMNSALAIMGQPANSKFSDIFIVLILGFVVYIIWSLIFHSWMNELEKLSIPTRISKSIKKWQLEIDKFNSSIQSLETEAKMIDVELVQKRKLLEGKYISLSLILKSISIYTHGWYKYLSGLNSGLKNQLIAACEEVLQSFRKQNNLMKYKITIEE